MELIIRGSVDEINTLLFDIVGGDSVPLPARVEKDIPDRTYELRKDERVKKILEKAKPADSVPKAPVIQKRDHDRKTESLKLLAKEELLIPGFEYNKKLAKFYKPIFVAELPDGRVALSYFSSVVFTTKEKILEIPYPFPGGYLKGLGMDKNKEVAIRHYRKYLASVLPGSRGPDRRQDIKDPDAQFKPVLRGVINTRPGHEDTDKIEGSLED